MAVKVSIYWKGSNGLVANLDFAFAPVIGSKFVINHDDETHICEIESVLHAPTISGSGVDPSIRCFVTRTKVKTMEKWWWAIKETLVEGLLKRFKLK